MPDWCLAAPNLPNMLLITFNFPWSASLDTNVNTNIGVPSICTKGKRFAKNVRGCESVPSTSCHYFEKDEGVDWKVSCF
jgi:hypothetical protein